MFYSQTHLARKGPLGTVWCAVHLQHRLKKSHYTSTDIPSTVELIMFPEVPIALRLSSHLLLGVVRIYEKKVYYLFHDCKVVLTGLHSALSRKGFSSIEVTLPEEASGTLFDSITRPETFDLDALELDDLTYYEGHQDIHSRSHEEITLTDQIPVERDLYVRFKTFDEDIMMDISQPVEAPDMGVRQMEEIYSPFVGGAGGESGDPGERSNSEVPKAKLRDDKTPQNIPGTEVPCDLDVQDSGPHNQTEVLQRLNDDDNSPQTAPEIEVLRDAFHDPPSASFDDMARPQERRDQTTSQKDILSPIAEEVSIPERLNPLFQPTSGSSASAASADRIDTHVSFGISPPELLLQPSPVEQPKARRRKRRMEFDESTVLTNRLMKNAIGDSSGLLRKRRAISCSALGVWKLNNNQRKEQTFMLPLISGLSSDLCNVFDKEYISTKPHLIPSEEVPLSPGAARTPILRTEASMDLGVQVQQSPAPAAAASPDSLLALSPNVASAIDYMEVERLRDVEGDNSDHILPDPVTMPRSGDITSLWSQNLGSPPVSSIGAATEIRELPIPDLPASCGPYESGFETPRTIIEDIGGAENSNLSNIPELMKSAELEELHILETYNSPAGSQGSQARDSLSVRTRAFAQYLKSRSPADPISEEASQGLSLNNILQGKTRKLCARMFYETLVLKSYDLLDVEQDVPYGDIRLKSKTPSKAQI